MSLDDNMPEPQNDEPMGGDDFGNEPPMGGEEPMGSEPDMDDDFGDGDDFGGDEEGDESTEHLINMYKSLTPQDKVAAERYIQSLTADDGGDENSEEPFDDEPMGGEEPPIMGDDGGFGDEGGNEPPMGGNPMKESFVREIVNNPTMTKRQGRRDYRKVGDDVPKKGNPFVSNRR